MENFEPINIPEGEFPVEGDKLGVFLKEKKLFHGSSNPRINRFMTNEEVSAANITDGATVGEGLYLTSSSKAADAYAHARAQSLRKKVDVEPTLYEVLVDGLKLLDLRNNTNIALFTESFRAHLLYVLKNEEERKKFGWMTINSIGDALQEIQKGVSLENIQKISGYGMTEIFTRFIKEQGYDGLVTWEGGEGYEDNPLTHTGNHDSFVIFDPEKVSVLGKNP